MLKEINPQVSSNNDLYSLPYFPHMGADPDGKPNTQNVCIMKTSGCLTAHFTPSILRLHVITSVCWFSGIQGHWAGPYPDTYIPHYHFCSQLHIDSSLSSG